MVSRVYVVHKIGFVMFVVHLQKSSSEWDNINWLVAIYLYHVVSYIHTYSYSHVTILYTVFIRIEARVSISYK